MKSCLRESVVWVQDTYNSLLSVDDHVKQQCSLIEAKEDQFITAMSTFIEQNARFGRPFLCDRYRQFESC